MTKKNKKIGQIGEKIALDYLKKEGFILLDKNFTSRWGEIDLILRKKEKIHFIEVKARLGNLKGQPYEAINKYKIIALKRAIQYYLLKNHLKNFKLSFDVVSIILTNNFKVLNFKFIENCFDFDLK